MTVRAVVVGSTNVDLVLPVVALPRAGETVLAESVRREPGGKGGNQAVALARLGAEVRFVSAVGRDPDGDWSLEQLAGDGVDVSAVARVDAATGLAVVAVDAAGENHIVVAAGANALVAAPAAVEGDVLLLSLEVPLETVAATARAARAAGVQVVLNAAPAAALSAELLADVDVLVVNASEWEALGRPTSGSVVVTRGGAGCEVWEAGRSWAQAAVPVEVVDTTGAGDCFAATLAWGVGAGWELRAAVELAGRAAAVSVTARGARTGMPSAAQLGLGG